ncbi:MAG TPA: HpcH/HpaI aldolase/citrate lyase family protein [Casimicrobiaceae bacterium]|nr:HpcH/HpaI aldolase/citrate lyase family protein [Casimicrobiaceae bacterium]
MDLPKNRFKHLIASDTPPLGVWLVSGAESTAEALGCAGFDFLVLDMEHTPIDMAQLVGMLRAIEGTPAGVITRIPWNDMVLVKRILDAGAQSLMFPFIQNVEEAKRAVSYTRYPPDGVRGVAAVHRASRHGNVPNYQRIAANELCVVAQIETITSLEQIPAIAAVPGIDSLFIGPADLSASMGHLGNLAHPDVLAKLEQGAKACRKAGKPVGIVGPNPDLVKRFLEMGYSWVAIGSDIGLMVNRATEWLGDVRGAIPSASKGTAAY